LINNKQSIRVFIVNGMLFLMLFGGGKREIDKDIIRRALRIVQEPFKERLRELWGREKLWGLKIFGGLFCLG